VIAPSDLLGSPAADGSTPVPPSTATAVTPVDDRAAPIRP
jgi:hypothetical protein